MPADDADLEIGLRWDPAQGGFDVNLRFENRASGTDEWSHPDDPLVIDLNHLQQLVHDEEAYGAALTQMVLGPQDIGHLFARVLTAIEVQSWRLHLRLHISGPPRFHAIRWESLRDPASGRPLATRPNVLLSRYLSSPDWRPISVPPKHDLRALIVVAGPEDIERYQPNGRSLAHVDVDEELTRARWALADLHVVEELAHGRATLADIVDALDEGIDVLYLVCHGALTDDVPRLYLEKPDRTADLVDGRKLVERLSELERRPTVVLLSSCQSAGAEAQASTDDDGELAALGPRLAAAGMAAVVAMQGDVSMTTAATFSKTFFRSLARHGVVDQAMTVARGAIRDQGDWWVPVLFSRLRSGRTYYKSEFTERADMTWAALRLHVGAGNVTPVLGPGLADSILGSRQEIAVRWVKRWQMPIASHNQRDLAQVTQYLRVRSAPGVVRNQMQEYLMNEIAEQRAQAPADDPVWRDFPDELIANGGSDPMLLEQALLEIGKRLRSTDEGDPYRVMASFDKVSVYVTTGWTDLLQAALRARDPSREPITMTFPWNEPIEADPPRDPLPTVDRPLVYHLFGRLDNPRSLVLSEDDYFEWMNAWIERRKDVPASVRKALTAKSLLFVGYRLDEWDFRVVFHGIKSFGGSSMLKENLHIGVQLSPENQMIEPEAAQEYLESYFGKDQVSIYWGNTRHFLDEMRQRTKLAT
jgi:hypothetical protein